MSNSEQTIPIQLNIIDDNQEKYYTCFLISNKDDTYESNYVYFVINKATKFIADKTVLIRDEMFKPSAIEYFMNDFATVPIILFLAKVLKLSLFEQNPNLQSANYDDDRILKLIEMSLYTIFGEEELENVMRYVGQDMFDIRKFDKQKLVTTYLASMTVSIGLSNLFKGKILDPVEFMQILKKSGKNEEYIRILVDSVNLTMVELSNDLATIVYDMINEIIIDAEELAEELLQDIFHSDNEEGGKLRQLFG